MAKKSGCSFLYVGSLLNSVNIYANIVPIQIWHGFPHAFNIQNSSKWHKTEVLPEIQLLQMCVRFQCLWQCCHFRADIQFCSRCKLITTDVRQPWTNYMNNGNKHLIVGADVRSEYSNI